AVLQELYTEIRNQVRRVSLEALTLPILDHNGIVIKPLSHKNIPIIKPGWVAFQMPLTNHCRLVARLLQYLRVGKLAAIKWCAAVSGYAIQVAVLAGQDSRAAGGTQGIGGKAVFQYHAFIADAINIG